MTSWITYLGAAVPKSAAVAVRRLLLEPRLRFVAGQPRVPTANVRDGQIVRVLGPASNDQMLITDKNLG